MGASRHGDRGSSLGNCPSLPWFAACTISCGDIGDDTLYGITSLPVEWALILLLVSLPPIGPPALSLSTLVWRYVRQFVKMDAKEALQYVYCVCLASDQGEGIGNEQVENAWELVRRIIVLANSGPAWEELVGGFRPDGTQFVSRYMLCLLCRCSATRTFRVASLSRVPHCST